MPGEPYGSEPPREGRAGPPDRTCRRPRLQDRLFGCALLLAAPLLLLVFLVTGLSIGKMYPPWGMYMYEKSMLSLTLERFGRLVLLLAMGITLVAGLRIICSSRRSRGVALFAIASLTLAFLLSQIGILVEWLAHRLRAGIPSPWSRTEGSYIAMVDLMALGVLAGLWWWAERIWRVEPEASLHAPDPAFDRSGDLSARERP